MDGKSASRTDGLWRDNCTTCPFYVNLNSLSSIINRMRVRFLGPFSFCVWIACVTPSHYASAQHMNAKGVPCNKPSSTADETQCFYMAYREADKNLNQVYARVLKALESEEQQHLRDAQRL